MKKTLRILAIVFLGFLLFLFIFYLVKNEQLPEGKSGPEADQLATAMMESLNYSAWEATPEISWTFKGMNSYRWIKAEDMVEIILGDRPKIYLNTKSSSIAVRKQDVSENELEELKNQAVNNFNNDSFWLYAPFKVFDPGTERSIVTLADGREGLKVTYTSGGSTPGDSYVWILDENNRPTAVKMWVSILPLGGMEFTWENYTTLKTGAVIAQDHIGLGGINIDISEIDPEMNDEDIFEN